MWLVPAEGVAGALRRESFRPSHRDRLTAESHSCDRIVQSRCPFLFYLRFAWTAFCWSLGLWDCFSHLLLPPVWVGWLFETRPSGGWWSDTSCLSFVLSLVLTTTAKTSQVSQTHAGALCSLHVSPIGYCGASIGLALMLDGRRGYYQSGGPLTIFMKQALLIVP